MMTFFINKKGLFTDNFDNLNLPNYHMERFTVFFILITQLQL
jgi:hypothetical protein